ncbi:NRDE family protein [Nguyenibacter sp. L1]|nr:NRDE family protein [Nguyenibacter sp. L1]WRH88179.1 NRDE family protein [Nguyenibacter sp. L1]
MCTIVLSLAPGTAWPLLFGANRDERLDRPWDAPGRHWPDRPQVIGGRDRLAGGSWLAINDSGVVAGVMNRVGSLGPTPGKRSRGELPLLALDHQTAAQAARALAALDAGAWRSFNMIVADRRAAYYISGLGYGTPDVAQLEPGVHMAATTGPDDLSIPRIGRHLPRFCDAARPLPPDWASWTRLLSDRTLPAGSELNIPPRSGFGTCSSSVIGIAADPAAPASWHFAAGAPDRVGYAPVTLDAPGIP